MSAVSIFTKMLVGHGLPKATAKAAVYTGMGAAGGLAIGGVAARIAYRRGLARGLGTLAGPAAAAASAAKAQARAQTRARVKAYGSAALSNFPKMSEHGAAFLADAQRAPIWNKPISRISWADRARSAGHISYAFHTHIIKGALHDVGNTVAENSLRATKIVSLEARRGVRAVRKAAIPSTPGRMRPGKAASMSAPAQAKVRPKPIEKMTFEEVQAATRRYFDDGPIAIPGARQMPAPRVAPHVAPQATAPVAPEQVKTMWVRKGKNGVEIVRRTPEQVARIEARRGLIHSFSRLGNKKKN